MNGTFLDDRITKTKALIVAYEDAITALATHGTQSYKLDTGQSVQSVSKFDLPRLNTMLDSLYNRCATLETRKTGSGTTNVRPAW